MPLNKETKPNHKTIKFSISILFISICLIEDPIRCYHSEPECTWEWWQWKGTPYSPKLQYYWSLNIRLLRVICRHMLVVSYPSAEMQSVYSTVSADWASCCRKRTGQPKFGSWMRLFAFYILRITLESLYSPLKQTALICCWLWP